MQLFAAVTALCFIYLLSHLVEESLIDKHEHDNKFFLITVTVYFEPWLILHSKHRKEVVEYMKQHKDDFAPFLDESITFEKYCK